MANNPVVNSITFTGGVAGQASVQAQGIAGNLTFLLPNTTPITGQLLDVQAVNGNNVFLGWVSAGTETISLSQLLQSGATTNQFISWNGTSWVPTSSVPGEGTVTSVTFTGDGTVLSSTPSSAVTTSGTVTATLASQSQNLVLASPNGSSGVPTFRKVAIADINSIEGVGSKVQTTSAGTTVAGDIVTYADTAGTIADSGTLLSSLATTASLSAYAPLAGAAFTGGVSVTASDGRAHLSDGNHAGVAFEFNQANDAAGVWIDDSGNLYPRQAVWDATGTPGTSGQLFSSTVTGTAWVSQSSLAIAGSQVTGNISGNAANVTGIVGLANGGTHADLSATGGAHFVLRQSGVGANITVSQLAASDLSDGTIGTGSLVLAASFQGTGTVIPTYDGGSSTNGDVVVFNAAGTQTDSGIPISSLATQSFVTTSYAPLASPSFSGTASFVNASISGTFADGTSFVGTSGQLLSSTVTGTAWLSQSSLTIAESQVTNLTTDLAAKATVYDRLGSSAGGQTIYTGTIGLSGATTVTLPAVYGNTNYKVQLTYYGSGFVMANAGFLTYTITDAQNFVITSSNGADANNVTWTTFPSNAS